MFFSPVVFVVFIIIIVRKPYIFFVFIVFVVVVMVTISISEETHTELRKIKGHLMASNGKERSFDDVIMELINLWKEKREG